MPVIQIKSLPFETAPDMDKVVQAISQDFAQACGIALEHISVLWEFIPAHHYAVAGKTCEYQPPDSHPLIIDLLIPDFNEAQRAELMLNSLAQSVSHHAKVPLDNMFINLRLARSAAVFDDGKVVRW